MKSIIFCLLISFCLCFGWDVFGYKNGTFTKGNKSPIIISGSLYYRESSSATEVLLFGMDYSTMTPILLVLRYPKTTTTGIEIKLHCLYAQHGLEDYEGLSGTGVLTGSLDKPEFKGECYTQTKDLWMFKSSNVKSETQFYPPKEAGLRAKFLIGQPISKYESHHVVFFAIIDYPYFERSCQSFLVSWFPDAPGLEPGVIVVGKDKKHCAILDNEGTKFIQSNSGTGKVTYDSVAVLQRYFPNGMIYKRCPEL